jgi:hypothetical protein
MRCDVMLEGSTGCSWLVEVLEGEQWEEVVTRTQDMLQSVCLPWAVTFTSTFTFTSRPLCWGGASPGGTAAG